MSEQVSTFSPSQEKFQLGRIGGYLGMAGAIISMLIFTVGCFGYFQVFMFMPFIPLALGSVGMVLSLIGGFSSRLSGIDDTQTFLAMFANFLALGGGFLELAVGNHWTIFYTAPGN